MPSQFGGVPIDDTPAVVPASKFGGVPVDAPDPYANLGAVGRNPIVRGALDATAGAGGALAQHAVGLYDLLRKIPGADKILPDSAMFHEAIKEATPDNTPAHIGNFLEGMTEYAIPGAKAAGVTKGMSLAARAAGQALAAGGVSAVQSGGDPAATATGALLGAGGEVVGDVARGAAAAFANKAPTLANFSESFGGATPTQKARISRALDVLTKDGITPPDSVHDTQDVIQGKLDDLAEAYRNLDPAIAARQTAPVQLVKDLTALQNQYTRRGVVTDETAYNAIADQIAKVQEIAKANGGRLNVEDLVHMKLNANGRTNWQSPDVEKSLWNNIGDAYRRSADALAPETTPLNRDFQKYTDLKQIVDQNIARGKGVAPTGLDLLMKRAAQHGVGAGVGGTVGAAIAGPPGAAAGSIVGGIVGPKLGKAAAQALQNAVDSGAFNALAPARQALLRSMSAMGDNAGVLKVLGQSATEETVVGR